MIRDLGSMEVHPRVGADKQKYRVCSCQTRKEGFVELTQAEWFAAFLQGRVQNIALLWLEPFGDPSKRVTFLENLSPEDRQ
jgi:hypothetical protein